MFAIPGGRRRLPDDVDVDGRRNGRANADVVFSSFLSTVRSKGGNSIQSANYRGESDTVLANGEGRGCTRGVLR